MNSDPNSDSKQCLESKLGQVHRVHTERTLVARTLHPGRAHNVVSWCALAPHRGPPPAVSQRAVAVSQAVSRSHVVVS